MENSIDDLFKNPWCPLFGHLPEIENNTPNTPTNRCVSIITEARSLWGINPFFHVTDTSWPEAEDLPPEKPPDISPLVSPDESHKEYSKYPYWKVKEARTIARTCYSVQRYLYRYSPYGHDATPDMAWREAIGIVRAESIPHLDQRITDPMILSILAIEKAWSVLEYVLYYREKEDDSSILKQVLIAGQLLAKAEKNISETTIKAQEETIESQEKVIKRTKPVGIFRKRDNHWALSFNEKTIRVKTKGLKGLADIHYLLHYPGKKISVFEVMARNRFNPDNLKENPLLDSVSVEQLKAALNCLMQKYEDAKTNGDIDEMDKSKGEIIVLEGTIKKAQGKGLKIRQFTNDTEKQRKNIWKRINHSLNALKTKHPPLFEHLSETIITGNECSYNPNNDPHWQYEDPNWTL